MVLFLLENTIAVQQNIYAFIEFTVIFLCRNEIDDNYDKLVQAIIKTVKFQKRLENTFLSQF